jgi:hypothetical protein
MRSAADAVRPERAVGVMMYSTPRRNLHISGLLTRESRIAVGYDARDWHRLFHSRGYRCRRGVASGAAHFFMLTMTP